MNTMAHNILFTFDLPLQSQYDYKHVVCIPPCSELSGGLVKPELKLGSGE